MSEQFDGVLVPSVSSAIVEAFQAHRPQVPLRMSKLQQRLVAIKRYKSGYYRADYEQLARDMCVLAGTAVVLHYSLDGGGSTYQIHDQKRPVQEFGPTYDTDDDESAMCEVLNATFDEIEDLLRNWGGELVCVNIPQVRDAIQSLPEGTFVDGKASTRPKLINLAETADRLIADGNQFAATRLLTTIQHQLRAAVSRNADFVVQGVIEATLESLDS